MILYNFTSQVEPEIENQWLEWLHEKHLPKIMTTGVFFSAMALRVNNGFKAVETAYAVQYSANNPEDIDRFLKENKLKLQSLKLFGENVLQFCNQLEVLSQHS